MRGENPGNKNVASLDSGVSEDRVRYLIQESLAGFAQSFSSSMEESFSNMHELILSTRAGNVSGQDVSNQSFSENPSHPPVQRPLARGMRIPHG